ncbi:MAG: hypothetical protein H7222_17660 [Methylotenera sp.]|nr:hypothetical protein [Oligoflexia bacterium]
MKHPKIGTVALIVYSDGKDIKLADTFSDDREIALFEDALKDGESDPIESVYEMRAHQQKEDEDFANYVEDLLSQPFVRTEIQVHGLAWLKSKIRIEEYQKSEMQAAEVIAKYAFDRYVSDPRLTDFLLAGPAARVRVRVFRVSHATQTKQHAA